MNDRKEKIDFLKGLAAGTRSLDELLPTIRVHWRQDKLDHDLFHCEELGLSVKGNEIPDKVDGKRLESIVMCHHGDCAILQPSEFDITLDLSK